MFHIWFVCVQPLGDCFETKTSAFVALTFFLKNVLYNVFATKKWKCSISYHSFSRLSWLLLISLMRQVLKIIDHFMLKTQFWLCFSKSRKTVKTSTFLLKNGILLHGLFCILIPWMKNLTCSEGGGGGGFNFSHQTHEVGDFLEQYKL